MKFTLLFYTDNWESGPTVELASMPTTGSVVWVRGADRDDEGAMYYVDNIMHAERGIDVEDTVYLYVRPYTGYALYAPKTEADRLTERITALEEKLTAACDRLAELHADNQHLLQLLEQQHAAATAQQRHTADWAGQLIQFADAIEDGQQNATDKLDDIAQHLQFIREQML